MQYPQYKCPAPGLHVLLHLLSSNLKTAIINGFILTADQMIYEHVIGVPLIDRSTNNLTAAALGLF